MNVNDKIRQKLNVSDKNCWDSGIIKYILNDKRALIYENESGKDVFILLHERTVELLDG